MTKSSEPLYLLGDGFARGFRFRRPVVRLRKRSEIHEAILQARKQSSVWIATKSHSTDQLLRAAFEHAKASLPPPRLGRMLLLFPPRPDTLPTLEELFDPIAWGTSSLRLLPPEELAEVVDAENRHELFVGGFVDPKTDTLILYRGDFERLSVPLSILKALGAGPKPDPSALSFTDYGQTVRLGDYQAASDAILYEADRDYRRQINAKRRKEERSFGACLRRLRILKGLRQNDFDSIPAKTIARIERGEVAKPHRTTLHKIAQRLDVEPSEIETY